MSVKHNALIRTDETGTGQEVANNLGGVGGGHTIVNASGTEMPAESKLQFGEGFSVADDSTNGKTVVTPDSVVLAKQEELSNLVLTGATNTSGAAIAAGTCFVLNGDFVVAKAGIANGATFTLNTNYEKKSVGSILTELVGTLGTDSWEVIFEAGLNRKYTDYVLWTYDEFKAILKSHKLIAAIGSYNYGANYSYGLMSSRYAYMPPNSWDFHRTDDFLCMLKLLEQGLLTTSETKPCLFTCNTWNNNRVNIYKRPSDNAIVLEDLDNTGSNKYPLKIVVI